MLFAPDVAKGPDGRYYLYYIPNASPVVSVAVCDTPAGHYEFYGFVHYSDGTLLGEKDGDDPQFDPGVFREGNVTYLYSGFCMPDDAVRKGATVTVLAEDMLTIIREPQAVAPGLYRAEGTSFADHAFLKLLPCGNVTICIILFTLLSTTMNCATLPERARLAPSPVRV